MSELAEAYWGWRTVSRRVRSVRAQSAFVAPVELRDEPALGNEFDVDPAANWMLVQIVLLHAHAAYTAEPSFPAPWLVIR